MLINIFKNNVDLKYKKITKDDGNIDILSISDEKYNILLNENKEVISETKYDVEIIPISIEQATKIFKAEQAKRISEYDWIHKRELDLKELGKNKHSEFTQLCQYREDLRNMDDLDINPDFDVANPVFPDIP